MMRIIDLQKGHFFGRVQQINQMGVYIYIYTFIIYIHTHTYIITYIPYPCLSFEVVYIYTHPTASELALRTLMSRTNHPLSAPPPVGCA